MDRDILRGLAGQIAEIAALDVHEETRRLYRGVNNLKMIRPVVLLDELPWNQLNGDGELTLHCEDEFLRGVEQNMRRTLYKWKHCRGDMLVEPFYVLDRVIEIGDMGIQTKEETLASDGDNNIISHHYEDQLSTFESLEVLHVPEIRVDDALTGQPDLKAVSRSVSSGDYVIFLSHNPSVIPDAQLATDKSGNLGWFDLGLFGHTHGGQMLFFSSLLGIGEDVPERYRGGWLKENRVDLLISPGVGTSVWPGRLFCFPQIHCLEVSY